MYPAVVNTLFGKGICPTSPSEIKEFEEHFQKYDEDFEYASQMPECFLRYRGRDDDCGVPTTDIYLAAVLPWETFPLEDDAQFLLMVCPQVKQAFS